jgi:hypothetical protein
MSDSAAIGRLTRRGLVKATAAATALGLSLGRVRSSSASPLRTVYVFDPTAEVVASGGGCATCGACRRHAENKVFATRALADARRAHPHCRCAIKAVRVSPIDFVKMFGASSGPAIRGEFDVRWAEVMGGLEMPAAG